MKFERIVRSGIVVDGLRPGDDPRLTLADVAWALEKWRWGGHHPDRVSILQHALAMVRRATELGHAPEHRFACLHHDDAEAFVEDLPTTLKAQAEMDWYRQTEGTCHDSLARRWYPELADFPWKLVKPLDRAALAVESSRFPDTPDRREHIPFRAPTLGLTWDHYRLTDGAAEWLAMHETLRRELRRSEAVLLLNRDNLPRFVHARVSERFVSLVDSETGAVIPGSIRRREDFPELRNGALLRVTETEKAGTPEEVPAKCKCGDDSSG